MVMTALLRLTLLRQSEHEQTTPSFSELEIELKAWSRKAFVFHIQSKE